MRRTISVNALPPSHTCKYHWVVSATPKRRMCGLLTMVRANMFTSCRRSMSLRKMNCRGSQVSNGTSAVGADSPKWLLRRLLRLELAQSGADRVRSRLSSCVNAEKAHNDDYDWHHSPITKAMNTPCIEELDPSGYYSTRQPCRGIN